MQIIKISPQLLQFDLNRTYVLFQILRNIDILISGIMNHICVNIHILIYPFKRM